MSAGETLTPDPAGTAGGGPGIEREGTEPAVRAAPIRRWSWLALLDPLDVVLAAGLVVLALNARLPIMRNAFDYARASRYIVEAGYNPLPVVAHPGMSYGKPIGFSILAVPLNLAFGPNLGMKLLSFLCTALFAVVARAFFVRVNPLARVDAGYLPLEMALLFGNPLVLYQFWSGYPDTLFAAEVLAAFLLADRVARGGPERAARSVLLLGTVIYVALLTKLYAMFLGLACPLYILLVWTGTRPSWPAIRTRVAWLAVVFALLGASLVAARKGANPTIDMGASGSHDHSPGMQELEKGLDTLSVGTGVQVVAAYVAGLVLCFGLSLLFLSWRRPGQPWLHARTSFPVVFVLGLVPFGTDIVYNLRYFIPVYPFVVVAIAAGVAAARGWRGRGWLLAVHAGIALLLTVFYNVPPVFRALFALHQSVLVPTIGLGDRLDNLRMDQHLGLARQLVRLNSTVPRGGTLFWVEDYGRDATHVVIEDMLRRDIHVRYGSLGHVRAEDTVFVAENAMFPERLVDWRRDLDRGFRVEQLGDRVVRLEPLLTLDRPREGTIVAADAEVSLRASVPASSLTPDTRVQLLIDGQAIGEPHPPPVEMAVRLSPPGRHLASARLLGGVGKPIETTPRPFFVGVSAVERVIADCRDDVEERSDGVTDHESHDIELIRDDDLRDNQVVGLRFTDVEVPHGARIARAFVQFTSREPSHRLTELEVRAELAGSAVPFTRFDGPGERQTGKALVLWTPPQWMSAGERGAAQRTPDLAPLVQEVVSQAGWQPGNALDVVVEGSGRRVAYSCDGAHHPGEEPTLYIEYDATPPPAPVSGPAAAVVPHA